MINTTSKMGINNQFYGIEPAILSLTGSEDSSAPPNWTGSLATPNVAINSKNIDVSYYSTSLDDRYILVPKGYNMAYCYGGVQVIGGTPTATQTFTFIDTFIKLNNVRQNPSIGLCFGTESNSITHVCSSVPIFLNVKEGDKLIISFENGSSVNIYFYIAYFNIVFLNV